MIRLNPVQEGRESITRGLFPKRKDLATFVRSEEFKDILDTDAITVEGETKIAKYFNIETKWIRLLEEYEEDDGKTTLSGFKRYFELLFLVKSESKRDEVWFSFFEGMHRHAAIVAGNVHQHISFVSLHSKTCNRRQTRCYNVHYRSNISKYLDFKF